MKDIYKTKKQLIQELEDARREISRGKTEKPEKYSAGAKAGITSETKYRFLAERMNDVVWTVDMNFNSTYVSPSHTRILGYTPEERVGQPGQNYVTEESFKRCVEALAYELERDGKEGVDPDRSLKLEIEYYHKDGSTVWMEDVISAIRDDKGKPIGLHGVSRDITERRKTEEALRESEQKLRWMFESIEDGIFIVGMDGKVMEANRGVEKITGYSRQQLLGQSGLDYIFLGFKGNSIGMLKKVIARGGMQKEVIVPMKTADGKAIEVEANSSILYDSAGAPKGLIGILRDVSERRRMEDALRTSEEKLRLTFASMADGIVVTDIEGNITDINEAQLRMFGFGDKSELMDKGGFDFLAERERGRALADMVTVYEKGFNIGATYIVVDKNGREFECELSTAMLRDAAGKPTGTVTAMRDVTERRKIQEALREANEKLQVVFDSIGEAVTVVDLDANIVDANKEALRLHGFNSKNEIVGRKSAELVAIIDRERAVADAVKSLKPPYLLGRSEYKLVDAGGREFDGEFNVAVIRDDRGKPSGFIGIARDVSERKRMAEALRESEEKYREVVERASDGIIIIQDEVIQYANQRVMDIAGVKPEEAIGTSMVKYIHPSELTKVLMLYKRRMAGEDIPATYETAFVHKDGHRVNVELNAGIIKYREEPADLVIIRDITERKKAEEALRESEKHYRLLAENLSDVIWIMDTNLRYTYASPSVTRLRGYSVEEAIAQPLEENMTPASLEAAIRIMSEEEAIQARGQSDPNRPVTLESELSCKDGSTVWVENRITYLRDSDGRLTGYLGVSRDITERKKWEESLRKSEEKYRNLVEREKDVIVSVDSLGFVKSINSAVEMWGYTADEALKMNFFDLIAPEWREVTATELQTRLLEKGEYVGETVVVRKDGEERPIEYSAVVVYDEQGQYAGAQAIVRDISERKKAEEAVQARERYFRAITDLSSGAALVVGLDGNIVDVTGGLERISGHSRERTLGRSALEFIHPDDLEKAGVAFNEALRKPGETVAFESRLKNARGDWQWMESMITNLLDNNDVRGIVNHLVDITERKKTEEDIKRHAGRIEALYGVAQVISQSSSLDTMLKDTLKKICAAMYTEYGCIFMMDLDDNALKLKAYRGVPEDMAHLFLTIDLTEQGMESIMGLKGPVTEIDGSYAVADVEKSQKLTAELVRNAIAATPFFRGKDMQGLVVVFTAEDRTFSSEDLELLKAISNEMSIGINNIMLLEKTRELSVTDELTGLYNRRYFFDMLDVEVSRASRTNHPFSVIMIDLDGFKEYNDKYGHSNGDTVLETFSQALRTSIRKSDMAFRYGGDEFALILSGADAERAKKIVQRMRAKWQKGPLKQSKIFGGHVGFSSGIAEYPENAESADGLIFLADAALYQAKKKGYEDKLVSELRTLSTDVMDVATQDQVYALAATVDARDPYTYGHSQRVADIALAIGEAIGMSAEDLAKLHAAALLHDIGKVGVPDAILTKAGKPTPEEWDVIKKHCAEGARILGYVKEFSNLVPIVLHHHEWYDGSGYPGGLKGLDIPPGARITGVADAYDTMVTKRPYRDAMAHKAACEELQRCAGTQFDPVIVDVWTKLVEKESK